VDFGLSINPRGLGVMRKEALLDGRIQRRRFMALVTMVVMVLIGFLVKGFIGRGRKEVKQFIFIIWDVHI
jgi:hypothetical protein